MKKLLLVGLVFCICRNSFSQISIAGIINDYAAIQAINPCNNTFTVSNSTAFKTGDTVLVIQMKGADISTSNNAAFGTINNYNGAGKYEFNYVSGKNGNILTFKNNPVNVYDVLSGTVQLVRVPSYANAQVTGMLTCPSWDGAIGGVVVIKVNNNLSLGANIDVSGKGFRGGTLCSNPDGGCAGSDNTKYSYTISSGLGAEKGEGITATVSSMNGGMGAWANGGGGGNKHNSGGGGGGNFTAGGKGGNQANFCSLQLIGGEGGKALDNSSDRLFFGGGGGCSDNNNAVGTIGTNGGGIIIIETASITGNGFSILSNGTDVGVITNTIGDGAGGAGAGGSIFISADIYTTALNIRANGGKGGDQNTSYGSCFGPGGGGGIGAVMLSVANLPGAVSVSTNAGTAGVHLNSASACYLQSFGASAGTAGNAVFKNQTLIKSATAFSPSSNNRTVVQKCTAQDITLAARNGFTYLWNPATNLSAANVQHPVCNASSNKEYIVTITNSSTSCALIDTIEVNIAQSITPLFVAVPELCIGATAPLLPLSSSNSISGSWLPATISTAAEETGVYTFTPNTGQCASTVTMNVRVVKKADNLFLATDTFICPNATLTLTPAGNYHTYLWNDFSTSPSLAVSAAGKYWVDVKNINGCTHSDTITVTSLLNCDDIFFPNSFSPDGSSYNDSFGPLGNLAAISKYQLKIFNRNGELIFASGNPGQKWDGKYKGKNADPGNFVFIATYIYKGQFKKQVKNNLLLIR